MKRLRAGVSVLRRGRQIELPVRCLTAFRVARVCSRSRAWRRLLSIGTGLLVGVAAAGIAHATVTLDYNAAPGTAVRVDLNPAYWTDFSSTCVWANGPGCAPPSPPGGKVQPLPNPSGSADDPNNDGTGGEAKALLFSWGEQLDPRNSILQVTYTGQSFELKDIRFDTDALAPDRDLGPVLGPGPPDELPTYSPTQGIGTMVAYERDFTKTMLPPSLGGTEQTRHFISDQRMDITVRDAGGGLIDSLQDVAVAVPDAMKDLRDDSTDFYGPGGEPDQPGGDPTDPGVGITPWAINQAYAFPNPVTVNSGYVFEFRFYEAVDRWNNSDFSDVQAPDAYYGDFFLTLNATPLGEPALSVLNDDDQQTGIDFGSIRAGTVTQSLTATNSGAAGSTLESVTFDELTGPGAGNLAFADTRNAAPADLGAGVALGDSDNAARAYTPVLGVGNLEPVPLDAEQVVGATNGSGSPQTRNITGNIVGPVLGVSPDEGATNLPYGSTIDLGDVAIGDTAQKQLFVSNLFQQDFGTDTSLSFYNVGIENDPENYYCILSGPGENCGGQTLFANKTILANGRELTDDGINPTVPGMELSDLWIQFRPTDVLPAGYAPVLAFYTDMNRAFDIGLAGALRIEFLLAPNSNAVPVSGTILLLGSGLLGLAAARRKRLSVALTDD
jgi:hypothetical protein